jgi:hypothetical protein
VFEDLDIEHDHSTTEQRCMQRLLVCGQVLFKDFSDTNSNYTANALIDSQFISYQQTFFNIETENSSDNIVAVSENVLKIVVFLDSFSTCCAIILADDLPPKKVFFLAVCCYLLKFTVQLNHRFL